MSQSFEETVATIVTQTSLDQLAASVTRLIQPIAKFGFNDPSCGVFLELVGMVIESALKAPDRSERLQSVLQAVGSGASFRHLAILTCALEQEPLPGCGAEEVKTVVAAAEQKAATPDHLEALKHLRANPGDSPEEAIAQAAAIPGDDDAEASDMAAILQLMEEVEAVAAELIEAI